MIKGFRDSRAKALFEQQDVPALRHIERAARRKLEALDSALNWVILRLHEATISKL